MKDDNRDIDDVFLTRACNVVDDPVYDPYASWSQSGKSFIISDPLAFNGVVMCVPRDITSLLPFILSSYGFKRVGGFERYEYANDNFVRGQHQLMRNIPKPGFFITQESMVNHIGKLTKEKEELHAELRKQEMLIKELKYHLHHIGICKL